MIVLTLLAGGAGLWQVLIIDQAISDAREKEQQRAWSLELLASGHRLVAALDHMLLTEDPLLASTEVAVSLGSLSLYVETLAKSGGEIGASDLVEEMQVAYDALRQAVSEVDKLARQELWAEVGVALEQEVRPANERMGLLIRRLVRQADQDAEAVTLHAQSVVRQAILLLVVLVTLTTAIALGWRQFVFRGLSSSITELRRGVARISSGDLEYKLYVRTGDEIEELGEEFNKMADELTGLVGSLERRVAERTADLERRSGYLEASAEVGRAATSILDPDQLIQQAVELVRERFGLYYVGLFLVDERHEWAVLRAGTGEAGQAMLARGHRIRIGEGMIGWSIANTQARIALDVGEDAVRLATTELPDTRSEAALPLRSRAQVLGALTVQSDQPAAFDEDTVVVLQTMADQVAVALDNARLFAAAQESLEVTRRAYGEVGRKAWAELLRTRTGTGYQADETGVVTLEVAAPETWGTEARRAWQMKRAVQRDAGESVEERALALPIQVRGETIGVLDVCKPGAAGEWAREEMAQLETLVEQLGVALENARLYEETQLRAERERIIAGITARVRASMDPETILRTAVRELGAALGADRAFVRLGRGAMTNDK
jgi:GAF domain-containing protein/HAMP domain-containing protein